MSWSSTCHLGKGPEHTYPHDPKTTLPVPPLTYFEASTLSLLAILFSLSHIATIRKNIPARLFPLNVNLLTSGLYATLHTLSPLFQCDSYKVSGNFYIYLPSFTSPSFTVLPLLYVATCKLHHILLPSATFFCIHFWIYKILAYARKTNNNYDRSRINLFIFQDQDTHGLYQAFHWEYGVEKDICKFYIRGSVHRESNLITVQQDATYSVSCISVGSSTCFGCRHPSSGARKL